MQHDTGEDRIYRGLVVILFVLLAAIVFGWIALTFIFTKKEHNGRSAQAVEILTQEEIRLLSSVPPMEGASFRYRRKFATSS